MGEESFTSFIGVSIMFGAALVLFYNAGQRNSRTKRTFAFAVLLLGELLLFPWDSPVEWLRIAVIAGTNYVIGADRKVLDGVVETIVNLFRRPPTGGSGGSVTGEAGEGAPRADAPPAQKDEDQDLANEGALERPGLAASELMRRMLWPDLPL